MGTELRVVMFTDQVKSTAGTAQRVSAEIKQVSRDQDDLTGEVAREYRGRILKDTGDGHLIEFLSCPDAVRCGSVLQGRVEARNAALSNDRLKFELHVGIDFGEVVVLPSGDVRGDAANRAARVCSEGPPGEVYVTEKVVGEVHSREARFEQVGSFALKGVTGAVSLYRLAEWLGPLEAVPNPFIWRSGITRAEDFFNRDNEQRTLRAYLQGRQNCQIVGPRRIGKTSLLRQVERAVHEWDKAALVAYLDLQDPRCFTIAGWFQRAGSQFGWAKPSRSLAQFSERVDGMLAQGQHPVLCVDEFEELTTRRGEFDSDFFLAMRSCGQRGMSILTASQKSLSGLTDPGDPSSPFYNTFPVLSLGPFSQDDAEDFLTVHRPGVAPFTANEGNAILKFAKAQPLALQVACFHVLETRQRGDDLSDAIDRAQQDMKAHLPAIW